MFKGLQVKVKCLINNFFYSKLFFRSDVILPFLILYDSIQMMDYISAEDKNSLFHEHSLCIKCDLSVCLPQYVRGSDPVLKLLDDNGNIAEELSILKWNTDSVEEFLSEKLDRI